MTEYITAERFRAAVGRDHENDDLGRCNCGIVGAVGHTLCGWDATTDLPRFIAVERLRGRNIRAEDREPGCRRAGEPARQWIVGSEAGVMGGHLIAVTGSPAIPAAALRPDVSYCPDAIDNDCHLIWWPDELPVPFFLGERGDRRVDGTRFIEEDAERTAHQNFRDGRTVYLDCISAKDAEIAELREVIDDVVGLVLSREARIAELDTELALLRRAACDDAARTPAPPNTPPTAKSGGPAGTN
jgi:hypothetical protein